MSDPIIETHRLTRDFVRRQREEGRRRVRSTLRAVDHLDLTVRAGESVGYIGANGAGKSTTIKMLVGILVPTAGAVRTCGLDPLRQRKELARHVGVVFGQRSQLWWDLPTGESFAILGAIHRLTPRELGSRRDELVDRLELSDFLTTPVRQLSLGQRMRAEVAAALLHRPRLVILDEPTIGLDVLSKQRLREFLIGERREHGTTLLLTTHDMGDIERLCDRVLVVDHGRLVHDGTLAELSRAAGADRVLVVDAAAPGPDLTGIPGTNHLASEGDGMRQRLALRGGEAGLPSALAEIFGRVDVRDVSIEEPDIEDVVRRIYLARGR